MSSRLNDQNPYAVYAQSTLLEANPLRLIIALYEGAIEATEQAKAALASGDVWGRSRSISKGVNILAELMCSLDHKRGGEISANLKRLYSYMQQRLLLAHATKTAEPMSEVVSLLSNLLDSWQRLSDTKACVNDDEGELYSSAVIYAPEQQDAFSYGNYFMETPEASLNHVFSF